MAIASDADRGELEALMETKEYKNDFFDRAEAQGEARGKALGEATALLKILKARGMS
jgi:hypothetical protein